jgi:uncharacterized repeat protein (TIGR01451 family)
MVPVSKWMAAALATAVAALFGVVALAGPAEASMTRAFGIRYQADDTGDILLRGNSLVTCPPSAACTTAINRTATGNALNNNGYSMQFTDTDSDPATRSSSTAAVSLPAGATVAFAGLYWSAYTGAGGRTAPPAGTAKNRLLFKAPGDSAYRTITAAPAVPTNPVDGPSTGAPYVSFADVTSVVQGAGSGTYTGADIYAATGVDSYAAWSLVLVIHSPSFPQRHLVVFDGFGTIQNSAGDTTLDIPLTGLSTPPTGQVDVRLGAVVFEGDAGSTGDQFQIIAPGGTITTLSDAENPANNAFNSTNSDNGVEVAGRTPDGNTFGWDADVFQSSVLLGNSATTATLRMATGGETFFPAVATFVSNIYAPRLDVTRSAAVTDTVPDGRTRPGDRITYTIDVTNNGNDESDNTRITDAIPTGTTYVPGSLTVDGTSVSDAADGDTGELAGGTLAVRLGSAAGASGGSGGTLLPAATTRIKYTVQISAPYTAGGTVSGTTAAAYSDPASRNFTTSSNTTSTTVQPARADLAVSQVPSPAAVQVTGSHAVTWTATVTNNGPETETAPVLVQALPAGVTGVSVAGATCTTSGTTLTCPLAALTPSSTTTVTFSATLAPAAPDPSTATATVSGDGTDPVSANNTAASPIGVNTSPGAVPDFAALNSPASSVDVDVLNNDTDPDTGDVLSISSVTAGAHGTTSIVGGKARYTLTDVAFIGTDSFSYTVCDARGGCDTSTVSVAVNDHRRADLAVAHAASPAVVQRSGVLSVIWTAIVTNAGPQDEPSPTLVETLPAGVTGVSVLGATCTTAGTTFTCPLAALVSGSSTTVNFLATLPATATDPSTASATVSGTIPDPDLSNNTATAPVGVNLPPLALPDTVALPSSALSVNVDAVANDLDPDADRLTVSTVAAPAHGTATIVGGKIHYTLTDYDFIGTEAFSYTVCDGRGGCSTATVSITVADHEVSDLGVTQVATPKLLQRNGSQVATWTVTVHNAGPNPDPRPVLVQTLPAGASAITAPGCTVSAAVVTCPLPSLANGETNQITVTATLPADAADPSTATATVSGASTDPNPADNTATAPVALNTAPVASKATAKLPSAAATVTIDALAGDKDADGDPLTITKLGTPKHGTAAIVNGKVVYTLTDLSFSGDDSFSYTVCDGRSGCDTAQITVSVADHRHPPVAVADSAKTVAGVPVKLDVTANDHDPDAEPLTLTRITRVALNGTVKLVKGQIVYTPDAGFMGTDTVHYEVCDPTGLCDQGVATIRVTSEPPLVLPDTGTVRPGGTTVINVLGNDVDPAGYPLGSVTIIRQPSSGTATVAKDNTIHYQASGDAVAGSSVTIRYRTCDKTGACAEGTLVLTVAGTPITGSNLAYTGNGDVGPAALVALVLLLAGALTVGQLRRGPRQG